MVVYGLVLCETGCNLEHVAWVILKTLSQGFASIGGTFGGGPCAKNSCSVSIPGDVDGDGVVGFNDLVQVLGVWGICSGCPEDLVEDGGGLNDLLVVLSNWS